MSIHLNILTTQKIRTQEFFFFFKVLETKTTTEMAFGFFNVLNMNQYLSKFLIHCIPWSDPGPFSTPSGIQLACLGLAEETAAHCLAHCTQQGDERRLGEKKHAEQHWLHLESPRTMKGQCVLTSDTVKHSTSTFLSISHLPEVAGKWGGRRKVWLELHCRERKSYRNTGPTLRSSRCICFDNWLTLC